jgi:hypothetical protein
VRAQTAAFCPIVGTQCKYVTNTPTTPLPFLLASALIQNKKNKRALCISASALGMPLLISIALPQFRCGEQARKKEFKWNHAAI